jgi:AraC-like DNA-binding protein
MGAKQTSAMNKAILLLKTTSSKVKDVAELCGLHTSAIYRNKQYKEWKENKRGKYGTTK